MFLPCPTATTPKKEEFRLSVSQFPLVNVNAGAPNRVEHHQLCSSNAHLAEECDQPKKNRKKQTNHNIKEFGAHGGY